MKLFKKLVVVGAFSLGIASVSACDLAENQKTGVIARYKVSSIDQIPNLLPTTGKISIYWDWDQTLHDGASGDVFRPREGQKTYDILKQLSEDERIDMAVLTARLQGYSKNKPVPGLKEEGKDPAELMEQKITQLVSGMLASNLGIEGWGALRNNPFEEFPIKGGQSNVVVRGQIIFAGSSLGVVKPEALEELDKRGMLLPSDYRVIVDDGTKVIEKFKSYYDILLFEENIVKEKVILIHFPYSEKKSIW